MARYVSALAAFLLVAGCDAAPVVRATSAAAGSVSYEFPAGRQDEAQRQAMLYCANLGRTAVLKEIKRAEDGFPTASYACR
jgi:hypothetical protein